MKQRLSRRCRGLEQQVPPLRYAPVGMTILFGNRHSRLQTNCLGTDILDYKPTAWEQTSSITNQLLGNRHSRLQTNCSGTDILDYKPTAWEQTSSITNQLLGNRHSRLQTKLSSRPERSVVEGPAVLLISYPVLLRPGMCPVVDLSNLSNRELGITLRSGQSLVSQQLLNRPQVSSLLQHVCAKGVAQGM